MKRVLVLREMEETENSRAWLDALNYYDEREVFNNLWWAIDNNKELKKSGVRLIEEHNRKGKLRGKKMPIEIERSIHLVRDAVLDRTITHGEIRFKLPTDLRYGLNNKNGELEYLFNDSNGQKHFPGDLVVNITLDNEGLEIDTGIETFGGKSWRPIKMDNETISRLLDQMDLLY